MLINFLQSMVELLLAQSFIIAFILLLRRLIRHFFGAQLAYQFWLILPLAMLARCFPESAVPDLPVQIPVNFPANLELYSHATSHDDVIAPLLIFSVWLVGVVSLGLAFFVQYKRYLRFIAPLERRDTVYLSCRSDLSPALVGLWRQKIVVPADFFIRYLAVEQDLIVRHESCHAKRGDPYFNVVWAIAQCLFWFNPLLHLAARRFRADQEIACDDAVIASSFQHRRIYADTLLKTQIDDASSGVALVCQMLSHHPLKERIMQLHRAKPSPRKLLIGKLIGAGMIAATSFLTWASSLPISTNLTSAEFAQSQALQKTGKKYSTQVKILVDGEKFSPRTISSSGVPATVVVDGKTGKWEFSYSIEQGKSDAGGETAQLSLEVKKQGEILSRPKIVALLGQPARIKSSGEGADKNFDITFEINLMAK